MEKRAYEKKVNGVRCYKGDIFPAPDVVFVFGSNPEGRHGAGAARVARERFGAVYGRGEGLQGDAYALPTKDLRVTRNGGLRSIAPEAITESVRRLYDVAREHPEKDFCVAYRNTARPSLNGYTGLEMIDMFNAAGPAPENVVFSEEWARTGRLVGYAEKKDNNIKNKDIMPNIRFYQTESAGYVERTKKNAAAADITVAVAVDYNTRGELLTKDVAGKKYVRLPIDAAGVSDNAVKDEAGLAALEFIQNVIDSGLPMNGIVLNVAGNGLYTLADPKFGIGQAQVDTFVTEFLRAVQADGRITIKGVRSGGQTGIDEAAVKAALACGIDAVVLAPKGWRMRGADGVDISDEALFKGRYAEAIAASQAVVDAVPEQAWSRFAPDGYEVSSRAADDLGKGFSALRATFLPGTVLAIGEDLVDVGGKSIEDVYQNDVKKSGKNLPPAEGSVVAIPAAARERISDEEAQDVSYERGYFPLWVVWATQHAAEMEALRAASGGRTLTDAFAATRVSQARALSELLAGRTLNPEGLVVDRDTYLARMKAAGREEAAAVAAANPVPAARPFDGDPDVRDAAYAMAFGGTLFDDARTTALMNRLSVMDADRRGAFRTAVLDEVRRLSPELMSAEPAAARKAHGLSAPEDMVDDLLVASTVTVEAKDAIRARIAELEKEMDPLLDRKKAEKDYAVRKEINEKLVPLWAERRALVARLSKFSVGGRPELDLSPRGRDVTLHNMTFVRGSRLGVIDIGDMSVADVYERFVAQAPMGSPAREGSIVEAPEGASEAERQDLEYEKGILPLVSKWARQRSNEVEALKAAMRQQTVAGPAMLRLSDGTAGRFSAARALTDVINGRQRELSKEELVDHFSVVPRPEVHPDLSADKLEGYNVYTVGTGQRSDREFWSLIPEDTDVIIDIRSYRQGQRRNPQMGDFKNTTLNATATKLHIEYREMDAASGTLPVWSNGSNLGDFKDDPRIVMAKTQVKGEGGRRRAYVVYDYGAYAKDPSFQKAMAEVKEIVDGGKKVCIIGSRADASFDARGLLVGQALDGMGISVAHIDTPRQGAVRIRPQDSVVRATLGASKTLRGKNFAGVTYQSDRTFTLPEGEEVVSIRLRSEDDVKERLAQGQARPWNFGVPVEFRRIDTGARTKTQPGGTQAAASIREGVKASDFSVNFYARRGDAQVQALKRASLYGMDMSLPERKEDYYDETRIHNAAQRIAREMAGVLMQRALAEDGVDLDAVNLFVGGSTLPNVAQVTQFNEDADARLVSARLSNAGYKLDDATGIDQHDIDHYVTEVLRGVNDLLNERAKRAEAGGDAYEIPIRIASVVSNYDTGVGQAAITAAQAIGMKPVAVYTLPVVTIEENDTSLGVEYVDEAMYRNRARGMAEPVSLTMLKDQIDEKEMMDQGRFLDPGLKDEHFVAMWEMGFTNPQMLDLAALARQHGFVVTDADSLSELLDLARNNYLDIPQGLDDSAVRAAYAEAQRKMVQWKEEGITVISETSPLYPDNLRRMPDEQHTRSHDEPIVDVDMLLDGRGNKVGVSLSDTGYDEKIVDAPLDVRRPALLWVKGDLSLLNSESVALLQAPDVMTSSSEKADIRRFTAVAADEQMPLVTSLDNGPATALDMVHEDGRVIAVSSDGIPTYDISRRRLEDLTAEIDRTRDVMIALRGTPVEYLRSGMDALKEKGFVNMDSFGAMPAKYIPQTAALFMENKDMFLAAAEEYPSEDIRDSLSRKVNELVAQKEARRRMVNQAEDTAEKIVEAGGLVMSETPPGEKASADAPEMDRSSRIVHWMGDAVAMISEAAKSNPSLVEILAKAVYAPIYITHKALGGDGFKPAVDRMKKDARFKNDPEVQNMDPEDVKVLPSGEDTSHAVLEAARENRAEAERRAEAEDPSLEARVAERVSVSELPQWRRLREAAEYVRNAVGDRLEQVFAGPKAPLAEARIDILTLGHDRIFVAPEGQPQIDEAIKARYGADAVIVDPFTARIMRDEYRTGTAYVDGVSFERWPDSGDTRPLRGGIDRERVYFYRGRVLDLGEVPSGAMQLPLPRERREALAAWKDFIRGARALQRELQAAAGFTENAQLRFAKAEYLNIPDSNTVEVRRGDDVRCRIWLEDGEIKAKNISFSNDFQEYHETPVYPILEREPRSVGRGDLEGFLDDIREALTTRPKAETLAVQEALSDRATADEYKEKFDNGFIKPREDNADIAANDVAWAAQEGLLPEKTAVRKVDDEERIGLFAAAERRLEIDEKKMSQLEKTIATTSKALESVEDADEREALSTKISDSYLLRRDLARRVADMRDLREAALYRGDLIVTGEDKKSQKVVVSVGGYPIEVSKKGMKKEQVDAAREKMQSILGIGTKEEPEKKEVFETVKEEARNKGAEEKAPQQKAVKNAPEPVILGKVDVINIHKEPERMKEPGYVYIGRTKKGAPANILGNPFTSIKDRASQAEFVCETRDESITRYREYCDRQYAENPAYKKTLDALAKRVFNGETIVLGCFCKPLPCHGDILREKILSLAKDLGEKQAMAEDPAEEFRALSEWLAAAEKDPALKASQEYEEKVARVQELIKENERRSPGDGTPEAAYVKTSEPYNGFGKGYAEDGTFRLLDEAGKAVSPVWFKAMYAPKEGVSMLQDRDGKFRFFDYGEGKVIGEAYEKAADFKEGFALVQRADGRRNFLKKDGAYLSQKVWFDDAKSFSGGVAKVRVATSIFTITPDGAYAKKILGEEKQYKPQGDQPNPHQQKPGVGERKPK